MLAGCSPPGTARQHVWAPSPPPLEPGGMARVSPPAYPPSFPTPHSRRPAPKGLCSGPHWTVLKAGSKGERRAARTTTGPVLEPLSKRPERSTRDCTGRRAGGASWLPPTLTRPGRVSSLVIVYFAALADAGASAAAAESAVTSAPAAAAAAAAPVTYCTGSPSPGSGQLPHAPSPRTPQPQGGCSRPDWQACGPIATEGRRAPPRPLLSSVRSL